MLRRAESRSRQRTRYACPGRTAFRKRRVRCSRATLPPLRLTGRTVRRSAEPAASTAEPPLTPPFSRRLSRSPASLHPPLSRFLPRRRLLAHIPPSPVRPPSPLNPPCALCVQINSLLPSEKFLRVFRELFEKSSLNGVRGGAPAPPCSRKPPLRVLSRRLFSAHIPPRPSVRFRLSTRPAPSAHKLTCFFSPKSF